MSQIATISEFLLQAGTDFRIFDMGRTIRKISSQQFLDLENNLSPVPYPRANHAWFGIVFWNKQLSLQHYIWFVKLPLDEQGMLIQASRNHFLQIIVEALGAELEQAEAKNGQLPENPYTFIPNQQQLADFNSISRTRLKLGQSEYFATAKAYLENPAQHVWNEVPLQGLADFAASIEQASQQGLFIDHFHQWHDQVRFSLCVSLENQPLEVRITEVLASWLRQHPDNDQVWLHGLRALAQASSTGLVRQLLDECLQSRLRNNNNLLMVIAGRMWHHLADQDLFRGYIEALAEEDQHNRMFAAVYIDLVQIPLLRQQLLDMLRWTDKSEALTLAVGRLFSGK